MKKIIVLTLLIAATSSAHAVSSYLGTDNQEVTISSFTASASLPVVISTPLPAGTNTIGKVVVIDSGTNELDINPDGSIDVNASITISTLAIRGANGTTITSQGQGAGEALHVLNTGRAGLDGLSLVYTSSNTMIVGGALTLNGKANSVDLHAIAGRCTYNLAGGEDILLEKNTSENFQFDYVPVNLTVNLTAKDGGATCKVRITGAN